jgi:hypothetical protein
MFATSLTVSIFFLFSHVKFSIKRYASTHRVATMEKDTWEYIWQRCCDVTGGAKGSKVVLDELASDVIFKQQTLLNELEFMWIRQFWVQGRK